MSWPGFREWISFEQSWPHVEAESPEVAADRDWIGIASLELTTVCQLFAHHLLDRRIGRGDPSGEGVAGLFVEVPGEALELGGQT